jgi:hypothetical protein
MPEPRPALAGTYSPQSGEFFVAHLLYHIFSAFFTLFFVSLLMEKLSFIDYLRLFNFIFVYFFLFSSNALYFVYSYLISNIYYYSIINKAQKP